MWKKLTVLILAVLIAQLIPVIAFGQNQDDLLYLLLERQASEMPRETSVDQIRTIQSPAGGKSLQAHVIDGQLIYGTPMDVPNNDWKSTVTYVTHTSWTGRNPDLAGNIPSKYHGNFEPRYLGYNIYKNKVSNDRYPEDSAQIAPSKRNLIKNPWEQGICERNNDGISDEAWAVIAVAIAGYHKALANQGYPDFKNDAGFEGNPALAGDFKNRIRDYFKVLSVPRPGATGAVVEYHQTGKGVRYDTISVEWVAGPDFIVQSINPGVDKFALPGQTYRGQVKIQCVADQQYLSDPVTKRFYDVYAQGTELNLGSSFDVPISIAANGQYVDSVYGVSQTSFRGVSQIRSLNTTTRTIDFYWSVPAGFTGRTVKLAAEVNRNFVLAKEHGSSYWALEVKNELTNTNNYMEIPVTVIRQDEIETGWSLENTGENNLACTKIQVLAKKVKESDGSGKSSSETEETDQWEEISSPTCNQALKVKAVFSSNFSIAGWAKIRLYKYQDGYSMNQVGDTIKAHFNPGGVIEKEWDTVVGEGKYIFIATIDYLNNGDDPEKDWRTEKFTGDDGKDYEELIYEDNKLAKDITGQAAIYVPPTPTYHDQPAYYAPIIIKPEYGEYEEDVMGWRKAKINFGKVYIIPRLVPDKDVTEYENEEGILDD